jgi:RHS repeat-associated protein
VERYLYDPYGKVTFLKANWSLQEVEGHADGTASAFANELLFTGHRLDPESGLYITLHRHYHPTLGRWMQRDPKGYVDGMSLYLYCGGCPLSRRDAMGLRITLDEPQASAYKGKKQKSIRRHSG